MMFQRISFFRLTYTQHNYEFTKIEVLAAITKKPGHIKMH